MDRRTFEKVFLNFLLIFLKSKKYALGDVTKVGFDCSGIFQKTFVLRSLAVYNPESIMVKVDRLGSECDTRSVNFLSIQSKNVKFVLADIKKCFPKLTKFEIIHSGLIHLEREDMRQFGSDLTNVNFWKNSLTAVEGDLFEFNPNLEYIGLHHNAFKYISPFLFTNFNKLTELKIVEFNNATCIDQKSHNLTKVQWYYEKCDDSQLKIKNLERIRDRQYFFIRVFPEIKTEIDTLKDEIKKLWSFLNYKTLNQKQKLDSLNVSTFAIQNTWSLVLLCCIALTFSYSCFLHCKISANKKNVKNLQMCMTQSYMMTQAREKSNDDLNEYEEPVELMNEQDLKQMVEMSTLNHYERPISTASVPVYDIM